MTRTPQGRKGTRYCFTINNYDRLADVARLKELRYKYIILGFETSSTGTPHIQGFVVLSKAQRTSELKKFMPRAHIEITVGSNQQAADYCKKEGDYWEDGTLPPPRGLATKIAWDNILKNAEEGNFEWIKNTYPKLWIQHGKRFHELEQPKHTILQGALHHEWWVGDTGLGKSRLLWELYPEHYQKETNKWWDGYERRYDVVAIEEWSPKNECTASFLKIWADRYPFTAQVKGASILKVRPQKVIVISNYTIEQCFPASQDAEPLLRRFTVLQFPYDVDYARQRARDYHEARRLQLASNSIAELTLSDATTVADTESDAPTVDLTGFDVTIEQSLGITQELSPSLGLCSCADVDV